MSVVTAPPRKPRARNRTFPPAGQLEHCQWLWLDHVPHYVCHCPHHDYMAPVAFLDSTRPVEP
jgi:hypothetical protein